MKFGDGQEVAKLLQPTQPDLRESLTTRLAPAWAQQTSFFKQLEFYALTYKKSQCFPMCLYKVSALGEREAK